MENKPPHENVIFHGRKVQYEAVKFNGIICYRVKPQQFAYQPRPPKD